MGPKCYWSKNFSLFIVKLKKLGFKRALNPNFLNLTKNREKFCFEKRFGPIS